MNAHCGGWQAMAGFALLAAFAPRVSAAAPPLVLIESAPGRFEIAAANPTLAHGVAAAAEEAWRLFTPPLGLPERFPSPIFVRVVAATEMESSLAPFQVTVEVGGLVSARLRDDAATIPTTRRMLVQALLMRLAVARHGVNERLTVPLWLEQGCAGWWETRVAAAQLDALRQFSARHAPPTLEPLLGWQRGGLDLPSNAASAVWLFIFLQSESGPAREWATFLLALLKGDDAMAAVASSFPGRFNSPAERELWWLTGFHQVRRVRTLPALEAADSREQLGALARFVFAGGTDETDVVVPLSVVLARADEPVVKVELTRRAGVLTKLLSSLHPFYRNAGLSLAEVFGSRSARPDRREAACVTFEQDWRDASELEAATRSALDALESGTAAGPKPVSPE
jgi:hypothetical protein